MTSKEESNAETLNADLSQDYFAEGGCLHAIRGCPTSLRWIEAIRVRSNPRRRDSSRDDASLAIFHAQPGIKCCYRGQDKRAGTNSRGLFTRQCRFPETLGRNYKVSTVSTPMIRSVVII